MSPVQAVSSTPVTPLTIQSKQSIVGIVQYGLIHHQLQFQFLTAQKASDMVDAFSSNLTPTNSVSPPKPDKNIS